MRRSIRSFKSAAMQTRCPPCRPGDSGSARVESAAIRSSAAVAQIAPDRPRRPVTAPKSAPARAKLAPPASR